MPSRKTVPLYLIAVCAALASSPAAATADGPDFYTVSVEQTSLLFDEGKGLSTEAQQYHHTAIINGVRREVDR